MVIVDEPPQTFHDCVGLDDRMEERPLEAWMVSDTFRPLFEPLLFNLVNWTAESLVPSWQTKKRSDKKRTDLFEWNRTLGDILARVAPFVALDVARNALIKPLLADDEEALSVLARFADMAVRRQVFDAATIPQNIIPLLDDCVSRVVQDRGFKPKSWHAGEVHGHSMPELIAALLFVNVEHAPGAARYLNGDWSQIDTVLPVIDPMVRNVGWSSSTFASGRVGPILFPNLARKRMRPSRRSATPKKDGPARCCQPEWPVLCSGRPTGIFAYNFQTRRNY
jgi:hypothetical protein